MEFAAYTLIADCHISPSELGIDMKKPEWYGMMLRVHQYVKKKESEAMKPHSKEPQTVMSFKEIDDLL